MSNTESVKKVSERTRGARNRTSLGPSRAEKTASDGRAGHQKGRRWRNSASGGKAVAQTAAPLAKEPVASTSTAAAAAAAAAESTSGDEGEMDDGQEAKALWSARVMEAFWLIRRENDKWLRANYQDILEENLKMHLEMEEKTPKLAWVDPPKPPKTAAKVKVRYYDETGAEEVVSVGVFELPAATPIIPPMFAWSKLDRNIAVDDETSLSHIPYLDQPDDKMGEDLMEVYDSIHGTRAGCGEFINDEMLYKLVADLMLKHFELDDTKDPPEELLAAVVEEFPNKCASVEQLQQRWDDLLGHYGSKEARRQLRAQVTPSVDDPNCPSMSADRAMHTYRQLFCPRCFIYNCPLHGLSELPPPRRVPQEADIDPEPCGADCYKHDEAATAGASACSSTPLSVDTGGAKAKTPPRKRTDVSLDDMVEEWTGQQQTMFRVGRQTFGEDYCFIATHFLFDEKTCRQVRAFAMIDEPPAPPADALLFSPQSSGKKTKSVKAKAQAFRTMKWAASGGQSTAGLMQNKHQYVPCYHPGVPCDRAGDACPCATKDTMCTKHCRCSKNCVIRFPGCECVGGCQTRACNCYFARWECDPDVCKACGAGDFSGAPINCRNVSIQRGLKKNVLLAQSDVAGWGIFLNESVKRHDFIAEYCGEVISQYEADRRGRVYDRKGLSYLFSINEELAIDATRRGNDIRFANHSKHPNCYSKIVFVNGDHRIGIYADRAIEPGEELFFDYRYGREQQLKFVPKELAVRAKPKGAKTAKEKHKKAPAEEPTE